VHVREAEEQSISVDCGAHAFEAYCAALLACCYSRVGALVMLLASCCWLFATRMLRALARVLQLTCDARALVARCVRFPRIARAVSCMRAPLLAPACVLTQHVNSAFGARMLAQCAIFVRRVVFHIKRCLFSAQALDRLRQCGDWRVERRQMDRGGGGAGDRHAQGLRSRRWCASHLATGR
jgi:hypothetical protein